MITPVRAIIFDFDDTILATFESRSPCLVHAASDFGQPISVDDIRGVWGKPFRDMILSLLPSVNFSVFYDHYSKLMRSYQPSLKPCARSAITKLKDLGLYLAVVSSSSRSLVQQDLMAVDLLHLVDSVWGYEDSSYHKPDPRALAPVLTHLELQMLPSQACICVGDSFRDYEAARGNGVRFFAVTTGTEKKEAFLQIGLREEFIVPTLCHLLHPDSLFMEYILPKA